jgi:hypothetical protein
MAGDVELTNRVRVAVLERTIETGSVPTAPELSARLGLGETEVVEAYRALGEGHIYVLEPSDQTRLRMANPFSAVATDFVVTVRGRRYFGNCAWDALGIVSLLGGEGTVSTRCPECQDELTLRVADRKLVDAEGIVHFSVPARRWWDDIVFT